MFGRREDEKKNEDDEMHLSLKPFIFFLTTHKDIFMRNITDNELSVSFASRNAMNFVSHWFASGSRINKNRFFFLCSIHKPVEHLSYPFNQRTNRSIYTYKNAHKENILFRCFRLSFLLWLLRTEKKPNRYS